MTADLHSPLSLPALAELTARIREERDRTQRLRAECGELKEQAEEAIRSAQRSISHSRRMIEELAEDGHFRPRNRK